MRASLGLTAVSVTPQVAWASDLPIERGALVLNVEGTGAVAGLEPGHVVTSIAGRPITDLHHFQKALSRHRIGETVEVTVWRDGRAITAPAVLAEEP